MPPPTYYKSLAHGFFPSIPVQPPSLTSWDGVVFLAQYYLSQNIESRAKIVKSHKNKYHLIQVDPQSNLDIILTFVKILSYMTVILPLIALIICGIDYTTNDSIYFYKKKEHSPSYFLNAASKPELLESMKALFALDPTVLQEKLDLNNASAFFLACIGNNLDAISWLHTLDSTFITEQVGDLHLHPPNIRTPFIEACHVASLETLELLTKLEPTVVQQQDSFGCTGFYYLCRRNFNNAVAFFLDKFPNAVSSIVHATPHYFLSNPLIPSSIQDLLRKKLNLGENPSKKWSTGTVIYDFYTWCNDPNINFSYYSENTLLEDPTHERAMRLINPNSDSLKTKKDYQHHYKKFALKSHPDKKKPWSTEDQDNWNLIQKWWTQFQLKQEYRTLPD